MPRIWTSDCPKLSLARGGMKLEIGQKVSYPNHGVCAVVGLAGKQLGSDLVECYTLRLLANDSVIHVPASNTEAVGIRPIISPVQCIELYNFLAADFEDADGDWKIRGKDFNEKLQSGCIFRAADVLKKLNFLAVQKPLSFREQRLMERTKFLVVSELAAVCGEPECDIEAKVDKLLLAARKKHELTAVNTISDVSH